MISGMRALLKPLLLAAPLALVPLKAGERDGGPFSFTVRTHQVQPEKSIVQQIFSGTGPARSPFTDVHR